MFKKVLVAVFVFSLILALSIAAFAFKDPNQIKRLPNTLPDAAKAGGEFKVAFPEMPPQCSKPMSAAQPANVVRHVKERAGDRTQLAMALDKPVSIGIGLKMVDRFGKRNLGFARQSFGHSSPELRMRIDPGSYRRTADRQFQNGIHRSQSAIDRKAHLSRKTTKLLTQSKRRGIGQMGTTDLDDVVPRVCFSLQ